MTTNYVGRPPSGARPSTAYAWNGAKIAGKMVFGASGAVLDFGHDRKPPAPVRDNCEIFKISHDVRKT